MAVTSRSDGPRITKYNIRVYGVGESCVSHPPSQLQKISQPCKSDCHRNGLIFAGTCQRGKNMPKNPFFAACRRVFSSRLRWKNHKTVCACVLFFGGRNVTVFRTGTWQRDFYVSIVHEWAPTNPLICKSLKGECHEIFCFWFFS
jgi:hypothetical protein